MAYLSGSDKEENVSVRHHLTISSAAEHGKRVDTAQSNCPWKNKSVYDVMQRDIHGSCF